MALTDNGIGLDDSCPANPTQIAGIRRAVADLARRGGAGPASVVRIELAVTEAATNVVLHAYRVPGIEGAIHVVAGLAKGFLEVSVRDDGVGMSPNPTSPGLGLGLSLIAHEADHCEIRRGDKSGTEVFMRFDIGTPARSQARRRVACGDPAGATA
jgi:serine/threonine-protein kinase RsbW/stage II sporulation protein AB (anti-sigma F factor)